MATTNITPAIDPETSDLLQEGNSGPVDAIRQIRQDGVATRATARGTWMKLAQLVGFGAILTASPVAAKSPAGFAHDAGLQSAVMRSDSAVQPSVIFVAGGGTAPAAQVANLPSAAPTAQEKTPAASIVVGVEVPPEFESSKAALDTAAKDIQAMIERTGGVVVKQVVIKTVDRQPVRRPDGTPDWDRIVGGLNNPIAKTYPIAGLTAKSSAAKAGAYAQIDELLTWVANENRPENFK